MAGGTGTRLWPLSRNETPKQFTKVLNENTLIRDTFVRIIKQYDIDDIYISASTKFVDMLKEQIPEVNADHYILEPVKLDRCAPIGLISLTLQAKGYDNLVLIPSDDYIGNVDEFLYALRTGAEINEAYPDRLLVYGMNPTYPNTGFGYIEMGEPIGRFGKDIVFTVKSFKEKPDKKTAESYIADWRYLWNASWFAFNLSYMVETYRSQVPETLNHLEKCYTLDPFSQEFYNEYSQCMKETFEIAIIEKLTDVIVLPASVGWFDVGSWKAVKDILTQNDDESNAFNGEVIELNTSGSLAISSKPGKTIALLGLKNIVVIDTDDVLLVTDIEHSQDVKKLVDTMPDKLK